MPLRPTHLFPHYAVLNDDITVNGVGSTSKLRFVMELCVSYSLPIPLFSPQPPSLPLHGGKVYLQPGINNSLLAVDPMNTNSLILQCTIIKADCGI